MHQLPRTLGPIAIWGLGVGYVISGMYFGWNLGAASRAILELGRSRYLPAIVGEVNATRGTPVAALVANMAIGLVALATGRTDEIIVIAVFGALTLYVASAAALIRLRRTEPELARPYRAPLYPATPLVAIGLSVICLGSMVAGHPVLALLYAGIVAASWLFFVMFVPADRRTSFRSG